jgi:hypothetical protein
MARGGGIKQQTEASLHLATVAYLRLALPPEVVVLHIPNGEKRDVRTAGKLKAMGVLAGALDFLLIFPGGVARWIELKTLSGSISEVQAIFMRRVEANDCPTAVCRTLEQVEATVAVWAHETGVSLKAHLTTGGTVRITRPDAPIFEGVGT